MNKKIASVVFVLVLSVAATYFIFTQETLKVEKLPKAELVSDSIVVAEPTILYGMVVDSLKVDQQSVKRNQSISDILLAYNVSHQTIFQLANKSRSVFDVRRIAANKKYTVIYAN